MTRAVLALGGNLGDRAGTLSAAVDDLRATLGIDVTAVSGLYQSVAVTLDGPDEQAPRYLNGVVIVDTTLSPRDLLEVTCGIENAHGRVRQERWGSRTLDIDIIDYGGITLDTPQLQLPHPRAAERSFVTVPWLEVEPEAVLPGLGRVADLPEGGPVFVHTTSASWDGAR